MFEGFKRAVTNVGGSDIAYVMAGSGPPLLLLHGFPQCKAMWARVAPQPGLTTQPEASGSPEFPRPTAGARPLPSPPGRLSGARRDRLPAQPDCIRRAAPGRLRPVRRIAQMSISGVHKESAPLYGVGCS